MHFYSSTAVKVQGDYRDYACCMYCTKYVHDVAPLYMHVFKV